MKDCTINNIVYDMKVIIAKILAQFFPVHKPQAVISSIIPIGINTNFARKPRYALDEIIPINNDWTPKITKKIEMSFISPGISFFVIFFSLTIKFTYFLSQLSLINLFHKFIWIRFIKHADYNLL